MGNDTHDRKVQQLARELYKQGFNVQADINNYETPDGIGKDGFVPDIVATKGRKTKIIEVDTPGTENSAQLRTFRRSAAQSSNTDFEHVITKPRRKKK